MIRKELTVLIVEDDDGHAELIKEGLIDAGVCNPIVRFANGLECWNHLCENFRREPYERSVLVLLDINMPVMDGIELLQKIKSDKLLQETPVVMLTTTDDPREVEQCYKIGCNFYITKPVDFPKFAETLKRLGLFIQIVTV